jgi:hypothetical protein
VKKNAALLLCFPSTKNCPSWGGTLHGERQGEERSSRQKAFLITLGNTRLAEHTLYWLLSLIHEVSHPQLVMKADGPAKTRTKYFQNVKQCSVSRAETIDTSLHLVEPLLRSGAEVITDTSSIILLNLPFRTMKFLISR